MLLNFRFLIVMGNKKNEKLEDNSKIDKSTEETMKTKASNSKELQSKEDKSSATEKTAAKENFILPAEKIPTSEQNQFVMPMDTPTKSMMTSDQIQKTLNAIVTPTKLFGSMELKTPEKVGLKRKNSKDEGKIPIKRDRNESSKTPIKRIRDGENMV